MPPRGPHPRDARDLGAEALPALREAVADLGWLLGRGYSQVAALKLVGDRLQLSKRQRHAVWRSAASEASIQGRAGHEVALRDVQDRLVIDGFNLLIPLERALAGGPVLVGVDGAVRDLGGVHGTWRVVETTDQAIEYVADVISGHTALWVLDRPVSNSGRLAERLRKVGEARGQRWEVRLEDHADRLVCEAEGVAVTSDAGILDRGRAWCNVAALVLDGMAEPWLVDLRGGS